MKEMEDGQLGISIDFEATFLKVEMKSWFKLGRITNYDFLL